MANYTIEYARKTWSGWQEKNYSVLSAGNLNELLEIFSREHEQETCRIRRVIRYDGLQGRRERKMSEAQETE